MNVPAFVQKIHHHSDIEKRNAGMAEFSNDLHLWRREDLLETNLTLHSGEHFLLAAWHSSQHARTRVTWHPNPELSRDEIVRRTIKSYAELVQSLIQGDPRITADIQSEYKTRGREVRFTAREQAGALELLRKVPAYAGFQGLILWGADTHGRSASVGLDTIAFHKPWEPRNGMIFVETDFPLPDWLPGFYATVCKSAAFVLDEKLWRELSF